MASIGGVSCDILNGTINGKRERVAVENMPGANSPTLQKLGLGGGTFALVAVRFGTLGTVSSWLTSIEDLQSNVVSIVDGHGTAWSNRAVGQVGGRKLERAIQPGTSNTHRGEITIQGVAI